MNQLTIKPPEQLDNTNLQIDIILENFYKSIDVVEETIRTYKKGINNFLIWVNVNNIHEIDKEVLKSYKKYLLNTYASGTANTYLASIRSLFKYLEEHGVVNPMKSIKGVKLERNLIRQPLTKEQTLSIMENEKPIDYDNIPKEMSRKERLNIIKQYRDYAIFNLLTINAPRQIEVSRANRIDIVRTGGRIALKVQGKGRENKAQYLILTDRTIKPLMMYLDLRGADEYAPLFIGLSTNNYGTRLTTRAISKIIKEMLIRNVYKDDSLTAHSLRYTGITLALEGGATLQETKEMARHKDINTTLIYAKNLNRFKNPTEDYIENYLNKEEE